MRFGNCHVVVVGLGSSGLACVRWLLAHQATVSVVDSRIDPPYVQALAEFPNVALRCGRLAEESFADADLVVVSPGVPLTTPAIAAFIRSGGEVVGDIELLARAIAGSNSKVIAITGSNGKSTVTTLVGHLCRQAGLSVIVAGNIGLPVLEALLQCETLRTMPDVWVLELSSFQLETTKSLAADAATVLNISEDHLDRYQDLLDYAHSKSAVFAGKGVQVLNREDPLVCAMLRTGRVVKWFSLTPDTDYGLVPRDGRYWLTVHGEPIFDIACLPLQGLHNAANVLAALALCDAIGVDHTRALPGIATCHGLPHRVERVAEIAGVVYLDDSKGTNVGATKAALMGMTRPVVLIAGGEGKEQDFSPLKAVCERVARAVILIGRDAPLIRTALGALPVPIIDCSTLEEATRTAAKLAHAGDSVLLSPACASFDMFENYVHRANVFVSVVHALQTESNA